MSDKPRTDVKKFAKYSLEFNRKELEQETDPVYKQIRRDIILQNLEDLERYHDILDERMSEGRDKHNRGKKLVLNENLEEARRVYRDGDSGEQLRRKLSQKGIDVSVRTARNYINRIK